MCTFNESRNSERLTAIWIGGRQYPNGGFELNLQQDIAAANVVLKSNAGLWQIPINVYKQMAVSLADLQLQVSKCGAIGKYLVEQMVDVNNKCADVKHWPHGEIWKLEDSPTVGVLLEEQKKDDIYDVIPASCVNYEDLTYTYKTKNRDIPVYKEVNARLTMADFYVKLQINYMQ